MEVEYKAKLPEKEEFIKLHQTTGWNAKGLYTNDQLFKAICNSWYAVSVYKGGELIAFGRIISDGIYQTLICDVMVDPFYQNQGIGKGVIENLLFKCKQEEIKWVQLFSANGKQDFYKKFGFVARDSASPGMSLFL
ncbi:GNAT family N-acetyltransferase [Metabacillus arenae]|uniref:GNAT family N-acetyltransferase n=1 Tax=Metabacillus arenae TaxID=2771434 RepID=A0A926RXS3_9BACI|nr:GNAT family N-acetyltransferase [Metabacillus arenae]MBD1380447.1 GNAT family N-acetyltransferase [Metabacillus arenae]